MTELILNWVADAFARSDIIDLYFIVSDLVDIPLSDDALFETAYFDTMSMNATEGSEAHPRANIPIGKLVL